MRGSARPTGPARRARGDAARAPGSAARAIIANGEDKGKIAAAIASRAVRLADRRGGEGEDARPAPWSPASTGSGPRARSRPARRCRGRPSRSADSSSRNRRARGRGRPASRPRARARRPRPPLAEDRRSPAAPAPPHGDPDQRHCQHREQFAEEDGVDRHGRGEDLDHLVRFLLDQLRQQHAGEQDGEEEQDRLAAARGELRAPIASAAGRTVGQGRRSSALARRRSARRGRGAPRRRASPAGGRCCRRPVTAPVKCGAASPPSSTPSTRPVLSLSKRVALRGEVGGRARPRPSSTNGRSLAERRQPFARGVERCEIGRRRRSPPPPAAACAASIRSPMPPNIDAHEHREQRAEQEQEEGLLNTVAMKSRRAMTKAERIISGTHAASSCGGAVAHLARRGLAGDGDEGVVQAGPLDAQRLDPGAAVDQRLEQGLGAAAREARSAIRRRLLRRRREAPRATGRRRRGCAGGRSGAAGRAPRRPRLRTRPCRRR